MKGFYIIGVWLLLLPVLQSVVSIRGQDQIGCRNEQGDAVDWFIVYKLPLAVARSAATRGKSGYSYLYMDGATAGQWMQSQVSIEDEGQSVGYTLNQYYSSRNNNASVFRLLYNDELPSGSVSSSKGHTKGALAFDFVSGFWLIHSVPKFPPEDAYAYPSTGAKYGQTFFCITFPYSMLGEIGNQLFFYDPYIYDSALPAVMAQEYEVLEKVIQGQTPKSEPYNRTTKLVSVGGMALTSFSKYKKWGEELYTDLVAPTVQYGLFTETWQNGKGDIGSNCTAFYRVYNVANVTLMSTLAFSNHNDHSKWAVSNETENDIGSQSGHWICIGDINRQQEQFFRSGGTACIQNEDVWRTFRGSVTRFEECPVQTKLT